MSLIRCNCSKTPGWNYRSEKEKEKDKTKTLARAAKNEDHKSELRIHNNCRTWKYTKDSWNEIGRIRNPKKNWNISKYNTDIKLAKILKRKKIKIARDVVPPVSKYLWYQLLVIWNVNNYQSYIGNYSVP